VHLVKKQIKISNQLVIIVKHSTMQLPQHHGRSQGSTWAMPPISPILQKGRTTAEWTWRHHRNANNDMHITQRLSSKIVKNKVAD